MYPFLRRYLFMLDPERAHRLMLTTLGLAGGLAPARWMLRMLYSAPSEPVSAFGLTFKNPIGLAAGYDRDAVAVRGLAALGFGHIEVGTVTPLPQPGNPRPRAVSAGRRSGAHRSHGIPEPGLGLRSETAEPRSERQLDDGHGRRFPEAQARLGCACPETHGRLHHRCQHRQEPEYTERAGRPRLPRIAAELRAVCGLPDDQRQTLRMRRGSMECADPKGSRNC